MLCIWSHWVSPPYTCLHEGLQYFRFFATPKPLHSNFLMPTCFFHHRASHSPLQITPHKNIARLLASGTCSFSPPFPMQMSPTANKPKGQGKHNRRSYLLMVFFVSFVEKRTYPWQHPLQKLLVSFWGGFISAGIFFIPLTPPLHWQWTKSMWNAPKNKTKRGSPDKKEKKEGGGKKQSTAARHSASVKLWGFFLSQHTCTDSQPAALLLFKTAPHQNLNAR